MLLNFVEFARAQVHTQHHSFFFELPSKHIQGRDDNKRHQVVGLYGMRSSMFECPTQIACVLAQTHRRKLPVLVHRYTAFSHRSPH